MARSRYDEVVDTVAEYARGLHIGNPLDPSVTLGPMASEQHPNRVLGYIDIARNSSARLVAGGGRPKDQDRGWFVEPTVFADVDNSDRLAREEVFGPVMAMIPFGGDDAVAMANDSNHGLGGSVWTTDEQRGIDVSWRCGPAASASTTTSWTSVRLRRDEGQRHRPGAWSRGLQPLPRVQVDLRQRRPADELTGRQPARGDVGAGWRGLVSDPAPGGSGAG